MHSHVGQVENSVRISAMVTGIVEFEPCLGHFLLSFSVYPFILLSFFLSVQHTSGAIQWSCTNWCNTLVLHQLGATHQSCTNLVQCKYCTSSVQHISLAPTWCNANTAPARCNTSVLHQLGAMQIPLHQV